MRLPSIGELFPGFLKQSIEDETESKTVKSEQDFGLAKTTDQVQPSERSQAISPQQWLPQMQSGFQHQPFQEYLQAPAIGNDIQDFQYGEVELGPDSGALEASDGMSDGLFDLGHPTPQVRPQNVLRDDSEQGSSERENSVEVLNPYEREAGQTNSETGRAPAVKTLPGSEEGQSKVTSTRPGGKGRGIYCQNKPNSCQGKVRVEKEHTNKVQESKGNSRKMKVSKEPHLLGTDVLQSSDANLV